MASVISFISKLAISEYQSFCFNHISNISIFSYQNWQYQNISHFVLIISAILVSSWSYQQYWNQPYISVYDDISNLGLNYTLTFILKSKLHSKNKNELFFIFLLAKAIGLCDILLFVDSARSLKTHMHKPPRFTNF